MSETIDNPLLSYPLNITETMSRQEKDQYESYFEETLTEFHPAIARVVSSYEVIKALQEELYQEISVALWKSLANFDHQSSLKTYILSIAHKRAISHVAKYAKEPRKQDIDNVELELVLKDCPSEQLAKSQRMNKLLAAMRRLPVFDRQLIALALEGISYKDIGEILGITTNLVGVKLNRSKAKLKTLMASGESK